MKRERAAAQGRRDEVRPDHVTGAISGSPLSPDMLAFAMRPVRRERNKKLYNRRAAW